MGVFHSFFLQQSSNALGKMLGKTRQEEKEATEDEMVRWQHLRNGCEYEQTLGNSEGQGVWCAAVHGVVRTQWLNSNDALLVYTTSSLSIHQSMDTWLLPHSGCCK